MNFLAHLWLTDRAALPLAGAILGDVLRGVLPADLPPALAQSVRLHRAVDAHTDRHPAVVAAREGFAPGARRYSGIVLDLVFDHVLAQDWAAHHAEPLELFSARSAREVADAGDWFERFGNWRPDAEGFDRLLQSYATTAGLQRAIERTARRLREPQRLVEAAAGWNQRLPALRGDLPRLLRDLSGVADSIRPKSNVTPLAPSAE